MVWVDGRSTRGARPCLDCDKKQHPSMGWVVGWLRLEGRSGSSRDMFRKFREDTKHGGEAHLSTRMQRLGREVGVG